MNNSLVKGENVSVWADEFDGCENEIITVAWRMITLGFDPEEFDEFATAIGKAAVMLDQLRHAVKPGGTNTVY